jgi:hypothetical protein
VIVSQALISKHPPPSNPLVGEVIGIACRKLPPPRLGSPEDDIILPLFGSF